MKPIGNSLRTAVALSGAVVVAFPTMAYAQATNGIGTILDSTAYTTDFSFVLSTLSYLIGITLACWGVMRLKLWSDGAGGVSIGEGIFRIAGGALMIAIPAVIDSVLNTVYAAWGNPAADGLNRISGLTSNYGNGTLGLDQMMENFVIDIYNPAKVVLQWAGYIIGIACIMNGTYRLAQAGQAAAGRAPSTKGTVGYIFGGALLFDFGDLMDSITSTMFGSATTGDFSSLYYAVPNINATEVNHVIQSLLAFIEIVGWVAFVRGIYLLIKIAQGGGEKTHAHAFTHIVFGALAVNMYSVVKAVQSTLGIQIFT